MKKELHGRDVAEQVYNQICDSLEVLEEDRFDQELETEDVERVSKMEELIVHYQRKLEDEESESMIELLNSQIERERKAIEHIKTQSDYDREILIKAIRKGNLTYDEENDKISYKLQTPITDKEKTKILTEKITFRPEFQQRDLDMEMKGVKLRDELEAGKAHLACFCNISRSRIGLVWKKDMAVIQSMSRLFTRAD